MMILSDISISKLGCKRVAAFITRCKEKKGLNSAVSCMKAAGSEVERQLLWCLKPVAIVDTNHEQCSSSGITIFFICSMSFLTLAKSDVFLLHTLLYPRSSPGICRCFIWIPGVRVPSRTSLFNRLPLCHIEFDVVFPYIKSR